jgi:hypothetical protein
VAWSYSFGLEDTVSSATPEEGNAALEAACAEAAIPVTGDHGPGDEDGDGAPFRRKEL